MQKVEWREKVVEVPSDAEQEYQERTKVVDVPRYTYKYVPKIKVCEVEKILYVDKVENRDLPIEQTVLVSTPRNVYSVQERKVQQVSMNYLIT